MNKTFTDTDITNAYDKTSLHTQDVIWAPETQELIRRVAGQNGLQKIEQKDIVADEILYLLIGLTTEEEMVVRLNDALALPEETIVKLATGLLVPLFGEDVSDVSSEGLSETPIAESAPNTSPPVPTKFETTVQPAPQEPTEPAVGNIPSPQTVQSVPRANSFVREKLDLRPDEPDKTPTPEKLEDGTPPKPLTRKDVLDALASRRTMSSDIESVKAGRNNPKE